MTMAMSRQNQFVVVFYIARNGIEMAKYFPSVMN